MMHRMRTMRRISRPLFTLSIRQALAALYTRRADIEELIHCLESQVRSCNLRGRLDIETTKRRRKLENSNRNERDNFASFPPTSFRF
jgi:hypothetical protein